MNVHQHEGDYNRKSVAQNENSEILLIRWSFFFFPTKSNANTICVMFTAPISYSDVCFQFVMPKTTFFSSLAKMNKTNVKMGLDL